MLLFKGYYFHLNFIITIYNGFLVPYNLNFLGGVLFSLEEGTSFWNQSLTWKTFFASIVSTFTLNVVLSAYHDVPGNLSYSGLLNLGKFDTFSYEFFELPIFLIMGAFGGFCGAVWNNINFKLTVYRMK